MFQGRIQDDPSDHPTMSILVFMLGNEAAGTLPSPKYKGNISPVSEIMTRGFKSEKKAIHKED